MKKSLTKSLIVALCALAMTLTVLGVQLYAWFAIGNPDVSGDMGVTDEGGEAGLTVEPGAGGPSGGAKFSILPGEKLSINISVKNNTSSAHSYRVRLNSIRVGYPTRDAGFAYGKKLIDLPDYFVTATEALYSEALIDENEFRKFVTPVTDAVSYALCPLSVTEYAYAGFLSSAGAAGEALSTGRQEIVPSYGALAYYDDPDGVFSVEANSAVILSLNLYFNPDRYVQAVLSDGVAVTLKNSNPYIGQEFELMLSLETVA